MHVGCLYVALEAQIMLVSGVATYQPGVLNCGCLQAGICFYLGSSNEKMGMLWVLSVYS